MITARIVLVTATLSLTLGCAKKDQKEAEPPVPVEVAAVRLGPIQRIVMAEGVLYPKDQASITPKISAPVRAFYVNRGDRVRRGQLLAVLENRDLAAAALESKAQYDQAQAAYRSTTAASVPQEVTKAELDADSTRQALDAAQKLYESRQQLFQQGALAQRLVDEAHVAYVQARTQFENAQKHLDALQKVGKEAQLQGAAAQLEAAKGHYEAAAAQLGYSEIRSPIDGVVTDRPIFPGEMASAGSPLLTIMDVSSVVVRANVPEREAAPLRAGSKAAVAQAEGSREVAGKVIVVSPAVDPNSTTMQVWVEASNPGGLFKAGATARVSIVAETIDDAVLVPPSALLPMPDGSTSVMVVGSDLVAHRRKVEAGVREPGAVQAVKGVSPGENVVVVGGLGLEDGAKVRIETPGRNAAGAGGEKR